MKGPGKFLMLRREAKVEDFENGHNLEEKRKKFQGPELIPEWFCSDLLLSPPSLISKHIKHGRLVEFST